LVVEEVSAAGSETLALVGVNTGFNPLPPNTGFGVRTGELEEHPSPPQEAEARTRTAR
jgi:hypothetical protein